MQIEIEKIISLEKSLEQVKGTLSSYCSYCTKKGMIDKAISVRNIILEVSSLLDSIISLRNTEKISYYLADKLAKQIKVLVEKLNSWEVRPLFTPEQLSEIISYSTFLEMEKY